MYIHLGKNTVVKDRDVIGIFDLETSTVMKNTRDYLANAEKSGKVVNVSYELPKSFAVCSDKKDSVKVYISPISTATLKGRAKNN